MKTEKNIKIKINCQMKFMLKLAKRKQKYNKIHLDIKILMKMKCILKTLKINNPTNNHITKLKQMKTNN